MRIGILVSGLALAALPVTVFAQEQARTPSEFVCELIGDECKDAPSAAEPSGERSGAATTTTKRGVARVSGKSRGFMLAKPVDDDDGQPKLGVPKATMGSAKLAKGGTKHSAGGGAGITLPPVDLRLGFATGSSALVGRELEEVINFASALKSAKLAGRKVRIEGHTDSVGSRTSNLDLSQRRAQAVVDTLVAQGVDRSRIEAVGLAFDRPLPGRSASYGGNRRVEAVLVN